MSQYFPKPYELFGGDVNVKVDLSNYATKLDLKNAKGIDTSKLEAKSDLASLQAEVNKIDIDQLKTILIDLRKLSNVVKNKVVKKIVYDKLVSKVNNIDISRFILKTKYDKDNSDLEKKLVMQTKKVPDTNELVIKKDYSAKITD